MPLTNSPDENSTTTASAVTSGASAAEHALGHQRMAALIELGRQFAIEQDPLALLQQVCTAARDMTQAQAAVVGVLSNDSREVLACLASGFDAASLTGFTSPIRFGATLGPILDGRRPLRLLNASGDPTVLGLPASHPKVFSYLGLPIASPTRVYGWLSCIDKLGGVAFGDADEQVVGRLAVQAAVAYENALRFQALRESEERTEFALRAARIGVWESDLVHDRVTYSDGMSLVFGRPLSELPNRWPGASTLVHPDDRQAFQDAWDAASLDQPGFFQQIRLFWPDETVHWADIHGRFLRDQNGRIQRIIGIAIDVTERKELAAALQMAQKMEAIGQLAGGIAHDFNNLLKAILGYSNLLLTNFDASTPNGRWADRIRQAGEIASGLTRQLLAFSRRQVLQPQVLQMNVIVERMKDLLARLLGEPIELVTRLDPSLMSVSVDPSQLQQIIMNLGINSRDAMPGCGRLTIETANVYLDEEFAARHRTVVPGPYVMLAVSDTGVGMDKNIQAHVFEPFFTTKERGKGTGLGLATVYGIVKQSGGSIWVYSEPHQGTTFKVYLPPAVQPAEVTAEPTLTFSLDGQETVLLVEDQPEVRQAVRDMLQRYGYTVIEASRGEEALLVIEQHVGPVHLLLTDVVMPSMTGRELASRLLASHRDVRVLYMSGYTNEAIVRHGSLEQGVAFIQKPFTPPELARRVREVLDAAGPPTA